MLLECKDVSKVFVDLKQKRGILALKKINLKVKKNEFLCIIGPSGCGKSTLLHMMAGFEKPSLGKILLKGKEIKGPSSERGVVFQEFSLYPWKNVISNVEFGLKVQGWPKKRRREIAKKYLDLVGLEGFDQAKIHELSGGMKKKVAIARTLAIDPEILLMDEPFGALDEQTRNRLDIELLNIWEKNKKTVVFVTHSIEESILLADRIVMLTARPGEIQLDLKMKLDRPRNLFSPEVVELRKKLLMNLMLCCPPENGEIPCCD